MRHFNPLMRRLLGAGVPSGPNVLLTVRGRKSGLPRTFPIAMLESGGRCFVQASFGEVNWVQNLRADDAVDEYIAEARHYPVFELRPRDGGPLREGGEPRES